MNREEIDLSHTGGITRLIHRVENLIQIGIAFSLLGIAAVILVYTVYHLVHQLASGREIIHTSIRAIQDILLVIIILEVLWTVVNYIESQSIPLEPFLFIAIISGVRGLILQSTKTIEAGHQDIYTIAMEIGIHGVSILLLVVALYILRKSRCFLKMEKEWGTKRSPKD